MELFTERLQAKLLHKQNWLCRESPSKIQSQNFTMTQAWTRLSWHCSLVLRIFSMWIFGNKQTTGRLGFCYEKWVPRNMINILTRYSWDCNFAETVKTLKQIFREHISLFNARFNCLNITKCDTVDFTTFAGTVNKECEQFKISSIKNEQFNCLIFVCGLRPERYRDVRTRIL